MVGHCLGQFQGEGWEHNIVLHGRNIAEMIMGIIGTE